MRTVTVLGATGKTGRAVTRAALARGMAVRATTRDPGSVPTQREGLSWHRADVVTGEGLAEALTGADAAYLVVPNVHPAEVEAVTRAAEVATSAGVGRVVYHSVADPADARMAHHVRKGAAEHALRRLRPDAVVLRPAAYFDNLSDAALAGLVRVPYRLDRSFTLVDLLDVGEAAATALGTDGTLAGATVELAGPRTATVAELAAEATAVLGRPVLAEQIPLAEWLAGPGASLPEQARADLLAMFAAYDETGLVVDGSALPGLIGRPATSWADHLRERAEAEEERV